jgi:hypothetical protein
VLLQEPGRAQRAELGWALARERLAVSSMETARQELPGRELIPARLAPGMTVLRMVRALRVLPWVFSFKKLRFA